MDYQTLITEIIETVLIPLLAILTGYFVKWIGAKAQQIKQDTQNELVNQYIDLLNDAIQKCVVATNQTLVDSLKGQNLFDKDAQEKAFEQTKQAVLGILTEEAATCLQNALGDLDTYIDQMIEAAVKENKIG